MNSRTVLLAIGLLLSAVVAFAQETPIDIQGSNYLRYDEGDEVDTRRAGFDYPDNTISRQFFENRTQLDLYRGNLRLGGRFLYFRPSEEDIYRDALAEVGKVDKRYIEATLNPFKIRAGHFSDVWGHGLALSSYENRDILFDTELDGLHVEFNSEPFFITALRGNSEEGRLVKRAEVSAARAGARAFGQALAFNYVNIDSGAYPESRIASIDWRIAAGPATFYGERAWNETELALSTASGHATYLGTVLSMWNWSLLAEYKDYAYQNATPFQNPATVYRELGPRLLQGREPHVMNIPNEVGYQLELSGRVTTSSYTTFHYNRASRHEADAANIPMPTLQQADAPYWEIFGSLEQDLPKNYRMFAELGANEEAAVLWQKRQWAWLRFWIPFRATQEIEIESETVLVTDKTSDEQKYTDQLVQVGWTNGGTLSLALGYEFSNDEALTDREGKGWPSIEAATTMGNGRHRLSLFYGRERGGLRCSNGVCRQVQAFTGLRLSLETSL